jgi:hypothetical protein
MAQLRTAIATIIVILALGASLSAFLAHSAAAAVVFDNYNGQNCLCGISGPTLDASGFTPTADYDFSAASAFVLNLNSDPQSFTMVLYSSTGAGTPGSSLGTIGAQVPGRNFAGAIITESYSGPPILLQNGVEYFFALNLPSGMTWLPGGPNQTPYYFSVNDGNSWNNGGPRDLQFQIFGHPVVGTSSVPEPTIWPMMLLSFVGIGVVASCRARKRARALTVA